MNNSSMPDGETQERTSFLWTSKFRALLVRLRGHAVILPDNAIGFAYLKRVNISPDLRHNVVSLAGGGYAFEGIVRASNTLTQHERTVAQTPRAEHQSKPLWKSHRTFQASGRSRGRGKGKGGFRRSILEEKTFPMIRGKVTRR